ncbi:MAG: ATP-binding protein [Bacteroidota bacterium]
MRTNKELIRSEYMKEAAAKTLKVGRAAAFIAIPVLTIFAVQDLLVYHLNEALIWRIISLVPFVLFLILAFTQFRRNPQLAIPFNALNILGMIVMMSGLVYVVFILSNPPLNLKYGVTLGYAVALFISLIISAGARQYLPYIIVFPLSILTVVLIFTQEMELSDWAFMSNIYIVAIVVMVFSHNQEKNAFRDFEMRQIIQSREEELSFQKDKLELANQELQAYNYSVSHDLRNPLRSILLYATFLRKDFEEKLGIKDQEHIIRIKESAMQMNQLIDDMLAFSKVGNKDLFLQILDMKDLFQEVFEELIRSESDRRNIRFNLTEIEEAYGDKAMIRQVITNLLSNALKYTQKVERAEIEIKGFWHGDEYVYQVKDNGVGFDANQSEEMFRVFHRLHTPEEFEGSGVGLAIVQKIVQRHKGRVWASGSRDQGASFFFCLPKGPRQRRVNQASISA